MGEHLEGVCWNGDRPAERPFRGSIRSRSGCRIGLPLCLACYTSAYLPLTANDWDRVPATDGGRTVLVVNESPNIRKLLAIVLEGEGLAVETAANG